MNPFIHAESQRLYLIDDRAEVDIKLTELFLLIAACPNDCLLECGLKELVYD